MKNVPPEAIARAIEAQRAIWEAFLRGAEIPRDLASRCMESFVELEEHAGIARPEPMSDDLADALGDRTRV